ncbi:glycosyl transferase family group 2-domain-containing protein [Corynascus novoguineensis]|uniref:Glycosyl transferase family group 2-domain-containing protein n=1 Tax=Corynascus novoguineensis TaxID=1126955 RepID=A0AAN7D2W4_9PEZI|nr:glycosyl transferase family group 2-domain-containing protein [Corynascus novoguineensis]
MKYQSYATSSTSEKSEGNDETQVTGTRPGSNTSTHQLQPIRPGGKSSGPATSPALTPSLASEAVPTSTRASMLSVPGVVGSQVQTPETATVRSGARSSPRTSRAPSLRNSFLPAHDARSRDSETINEIRNDMMVNWLYEQQLRKQYASGMDPYEGVVLKKARGTFTCCPPQMAAIPASLFAVATQMNVRCAMTVNTPVVRALLDAVVCRAELDHVPLPEGLRVQVLRTMADLPRGQLHHFAAFVEDARMLVVWDDEPEKLLARVQDLEARFIEIIWGNGDDEGEDDDTTVGGEHKGGIAGVAVHELDPGQLEEALAKENRPVRLESAFMVAVTLALWIVCPALGWRWLAYQTVVDGTYLRFALLAACPAQMFVSLFFFQSIVTSLFQVFGPISAVANNSKYYSGRAPRRLDRNQGALPHVTIQMPVYKETLNGVIKPTVLSLKAAISTYEMQGGSANIFVNDDGMQLISDEDAQARRDFYDEHNIGWVARPPHNPNPSADSGEKGFLRRGKFKKASNMNYALHVSNRVEDKLAAVKRGSKWNSEREEDAYQQCLADVLQEDEGRTWAEGNIRIGDYILLIDSDTRVPHDCLLDAVSEMEQSPEVAILQFQSGVMNVTNSFFENGVTWFTRLIYSCITFAVASGDACPFVGHNAILRWQALQDAAAFTDEDGYEKYWSESHVSEDFDMSLRLQVAGYTLRYASYTGDGFKEGVSLTVYDELARWEKYAYGCNELLFHPLRFWLVRGPFTPLFRRFVASRIPLPKKMTIIAYIGTYYAIAAAWLLTLGNYFITGWFYGLYDKYYQDSFAIYMSIIVVFTGLGNLALAVLRYRLSEQSLLSAYFENLKWIPMFCIFLGGISLHMSQAILSHFFEIDMAWGATAKELEEVRFGPEVLRIVRRFKWTFLYCFVCTALMICGNTVFPVQWRIDTFYSIYPLAATVVSHFALPVLLNPALMMFTW